MIIPAKAKKKIINTDFKNEINFCSLYMRTWAKKENSKSAETKIMFEKISLMSHPGTVFK